MMKNSRGDNPLGIMAGSASPFTLSAMLIAPENLADNVLSGDSTGMHVMLFISTLVVAVLYGFLVWTMYRSMVHNFDMTIRRQAI
jgi:hypothetical protein